MHRVFVYCYRLKLEMRSVEDRSSRSLVDAVALHADEPVLD